MTFSFISTPFCFDFFSRVLITLLVKIQQDLPVLYNWLDWYPGHSPKRRIRPTPLSPALIDADPNLKQSRAMSLHERPGGPGSLFSFSNLVRSPYTLSPPHPFSPQPLSKLSFTSCPLGGDQWSTRLLYYCFLRLLVPHYL
jgi:hypothetical protein